MLKRPLILIIGLTLGTLTGTAAWAGDIPWSSLSPEEQRTLSRARDNWDRMPTERQQRLLRGAQRWQNMDQGERDAARERWEQRRDKGDRYKKQRFEQRDKWRERRDRS